MERKRRKTPQKQHQQQQHSGQNVPNSWLDWNVDANTDAYENDSGDKYVETASSIQQRSKSAPKQGRTSTQNNDNNYGKLHSPTNEKQQQRQLGISLHLLRPKSAGKQRPIPMTKYDDGDDHDGAADVSTKTTTTANRNNCHATQQQQQHQHQQQGGQGVRHHSWASVLLLRKKSKSLTHHESSDNHQRHTTPSVGTSNNDTTQKKRNNLQQNTGVCDYCQQIVRDKSRSQMYQRAGYIYCSTDCTKRHHQALDADERGSGLVGRDAPMTHEVPSKSNHAPKTSKYINTAVVRNIDSQSPMIDPQQEHRTHQTQQQQQLQHMINVSYEEHTGNQFIPSTTKASYNAVQNSNIQFSNNWFQHNSGDEDNNVFETNYSFIGFDNSWGGDAQTSSVGQSTANPIVAPPSSDTSTYKYGRGISDEYKDYNDELSRQLRLAAKQDELEMEERMLKRRHHITTKPNHCHSSPGTCSRVSTNAIGSAFSNVSGGDGVCVGESSPDRYHAILKNMGVDGMTSTSTTNNRDAIRMKSKEDNDGSKCLILKQNENSTQSTESISSSSQGGVNSNEFARRNVGGVGLHQWGSTKQQQSINSGDDSKLKLDLAFEELDGWPYYDRMDKEDSKTPRKGNLSINSEVPSGDDDDDGGGVGKDREVSGSNDLVDERGNGNSSRSSNNNRIHNHRMTKSPPPSSSLYAISEDAPTTENTNKVSDLASFQFLAQRRGLRPIAPSPPSSALTSRVKPQLTKISPSNNHSTAWADHAVEDVVSIVSYYDDPSVDMLSSLATNDTITTISQQHYRGSPPLSRYSGGNPTSGPRTKANPNAMLKSDQKHLGSDPPGNLIDEILKEGIRQHQQVRNVHHKGRDASFQGVDPDEDPQWMEKQVSSEEQRRTAKNVHANDQPPKWLNPRRQHVENTVHSDPTRSVLTQQRHEQRSSLHHPPRQQNRQLSCEQSPKVLAPPQLRSSQQDWHWSENGPTNNKDEDEQFGHDDKGGFEVGGIEFPTREVLDGDDTSIGMLTGEEEDELQLNNRGDDDTATNTLDTVDLVAEVKRVWRHVQRYETKKHRKRDLKKQLRKNSLVILDAADSDEVPKNEDDDAVERIRENDNIMMGQLLQQFSEMQQEQLHQTDGDSKLSDITPFSSSYRLQISQSRGRATERPPIIPTDGRLGTHIRSTSSRSRTHADIPDSPGLASNQAMASRASTEKDAVFLNEGVDEFYEGQAKQAMNGYGTAAATTVAPHYPHADVSSDQYHQNSRIRQLRTQYLNKLQPIAQKLPQQYSNDYLCEEDLGKSLENRNQLLSKPYDMNKTRSTGTSFTQKTQQTSNMTLPQPSKLRSDMARKNVADCLNTRTAG